MNIKLNMKYARRLQINGVDLVFINCLVNSRAGGDQDQLRNNDNFVKDNNNIRYSIWIFIIWKEKGRSKELKQRKRLYLSNDASLISRKTSCMSSAASSLSPSSKSSPSTLSPPASMSYNEKPCFFDMSIQQMPVCQGIRQQLQDIFTLSGSF